MVLLMHVRATELSSSPEALRCRSDENKKKTDNEQRNCCVKFV